MDLMGQTSFQFASYVSKIKFLPLVEYELISLSPYLVELLSALITISDEYM